MDRFKSASQVIVLIGAEVLAIVALHRMAETMGVDWSNLSGWLELTALDDAIIAIVRIVALVLSYWLAASTILYTLAVASRVPAAIQAVEWATLPAVQKLARKAAAATLAASVAAPGLAGILLPPPSSLFESTTTEASTAVSDEPTVGVTDDGLILPPGITRPAYTPTPARDMTSFDVIPEAPKAPIAAQSQTEPAETVPTPNPGATEHEVVRGDNLWDISATHLASASGRSDLTDADIAPYWARVVAANADHVRSGNPDIIQPGEVIQLPSIEPT